MLPFGGAVSPSLNVRRMVAGISVRGGSRTVPGARRHVLSSLGRAAVTTMWACSPSLSFLLRSYLPLPSSLYSQTTSPDLDIEQELRVSRRSLGGHGSHSLCRVQIRNERRYLS